MAKCKRRKKILVWTMILCQLDFSPYDMQISNVIMKRMFVVRMPQLCDVGSFQFNINSSKSFSLIGYHYIYLFGVLHHFQHCTGHITTGSWNGRGNQYIQLVKVLYCKLLTNDKQLPAFPLEVGSGTEPQPQRWEARVLPLCHRGPLRFLEDSGVVNKRYILIIFYFYNTLQHLIHAKADSEEQHQNAIQQLIF